MDWFDGLLWPLMVAVGWVMFQFHRLFVALGLDFDSGASWGLSIVGLVVVMRIILIPLFFKQIKASRGMQMMAPELQAVQKKYKGKSDPASREAMGRETMELYRKHGTNPFASCLPILAQSPVFFALFRVLFSLPRIEDGTYDRSPNIGPITPEIASSINDGTIFGAPLSSSFFMEGATAQTRVVTALLIIAMSTTTFLTQRQLTRKNMPKAALEGPMAKQQKVLLYALPAIFLFTGVHFPIGVLIYWTTTNLWSMGQQFYTIRKLPAPGSEAEQAFKERKERKAARRRARRGEPDPLPEIETKAEPEKPVGGQRQQPKRSSRQQRSKATNQPKGGQSKPGPQQDPGKQGPAGQAKSGGQGKGAQGSQAGAAQGNGAQKKGSGQAKRPGTKPGGSTGGGKGRAGARPDAGDDPGSGLGEAGQ